MNNPEYESYKRELGDDLYKLFFSDEDIEEMSKVKERIDKIKE